MKTEDLYLTLVRWSEEDALYVGYCPDLFPWGGVCHAAMEEEAYRQLGELVREEIADLARESKPLPEPATRPMREPVPAWSRVPPQSGNLTVAEAVNRATANLLHAADSAAEREIALWFEMD